MTADKIKELVSRMTIEEKAGVLSGGSFWYTKEMDRLGIPRTMLSDGPHGLRKQDEAADHLGLNDSVPAVCFPAGCASASSFDRELIREMGEHLGNECQAEGISVLLGPAMNIKRSPLCGRNFEYLSEDPYVAGEISSALIKGVQSKNVGTSPKHFALNNQETRRISVSAQADERTMREIYLAGFERMVKEAKPWTIMCSYNRINGTYSASNEWLLTKVLREEWGFDGYVVSDWGAVDDKVTAIKAGLNLEMPTSGGINDRLVAAAVKAGELPEEVLDERVAEFLNIVFRYEENRDREAVFDRDADHELARRAASESMVLLKNNGALPLQETEKVVFIGKYAKKPRYQGGGSSHIHSHKVTSAVEAAKDMANVTFVQGFDDAADVIDEGMVQEAVEMAKQAGAAVIFAGLPDSFESEGYDRKHMRMPDSQNYLISEVAKVQPNTIVALHNGSPVEMPWIGEVAAVLECYLGGQAVGAAQVDILFGKVNPSGKLAETFPVRLEDNPSFLNFPGESDQVNYREGIFVGYRYYDAKKINVLFPFGHGLSYTAFSYSNLNVDKESIKDTDTVRVTVDVTNTGTFAGKEVVQLYVAGSSETVIRPEKELKGFEKITLAPGETKEVSFILDKRSFAYWNTALFGWYVETGTYTIKIGSSSRDIKLEKDIRVTSTQAVPRNYTIHTTMADMMEHPNFDEIFISIKHKINEIFGGSKAKEGNAAPSSEAITGELTAALIRDSSLRFAMCFGGGKISYEEILDIVEKLNRRED